VALLPVVLFVRETGAPAAKAVPFRFFEAAKVCLKNEAFLPYVLASSFFRLGFDMVVASIVFYARTVLHQTESIAGTLSGVTLGVCFLFFFPVDALAQRYGKKRVFQWGLLAFAALLPMLATIAHAPFLGRLLGPGIGSLLGAEGTPEDLIRVTHAFCVFLLISPPIATMFVLPRAIVADVMDLDAKNTGFRREGMYNGMEAVFTKTAAGASVIALNLLGFLDGPASGGSGDTVTLGMNALTAVGPVGGLLVLLGWWIMRRYPIEK
jgi:GPH family glycoside/pentoside/hexuronide:cation symporter